MLSNMFEKLNNKVKEGFLYRFNMNYIRITGVDGVRKYISLRRQAGNLEITIEKDIEISIDKGKNFVNLYLYKIEPIPKIPYTKVETKEGTHYAFGKVTEESLKDKLKDILR